MNLIHVDFSYIDESAEVCRAKESLFKNVDYNPDIKYSRGNLYKSAHYDAATKTLTLYDEKYNKTIVENVISVMACGD